MLKKFFAVYGVIFFLLTIFILGCQPTRPAHLKIVDRDLETYHDKGALKLKKEEMHRVAILVKHDNIEFGREAAEALDSSLTSVISDFDFFTITERSNIDSLLKETFIENLYKDGVKNIDILESEYLITARINSVRVIQRQRTEISENAASKILPYAISGADMVKSYAAAPRVQNTYYNVSASVDFRFYEKDTNRAILIRHIEETSPYETPTNQPGDIISQLTYIAQECAKKFGMEIGSRYAQSARVIEMRGNGRLAKVTMGSNYGLVKNVKVEFYEYVDHSDIIHGASREPSPVGYGIVIESDLRTAWVDIFEPSKVFVKRGHYVRISSDQSKGLKEQTEHFLRSLFVR